MQAQIKILSFGARLGNLGVGVNGITGATINFRNTPKAKPNFRIGINSNVSWASHSGTFIFSWVETSWFFIDSRKSAWLADKPSLVGQIGEIHVNGMAIGSAKLDVKFNVIDSKNDIISVFSKANIQTSDSQQFQIGSTSVRGKIHSVQHVSPLW